VNATDTPEITYGEYVRTGEKGVRARLITVLGEQFLQYGDGIYSVCGNCDNGYSGFKSHYAGIYGGQCFQCFGSGHGTKVGNDVEDAVRRAKKRISSRKSRARKIEREAAAKAEAGLAWRAANADLAAQLDAIQAEHHEVRDGKRSPADLAWSDFILAMANRITVGQPLDDKLTAATADAIEKARQAQAADKARQEASRYVGTEGEKLTGITGIAIYTDRVANEFDPYGGENAFLIIRGTGEWEGATFKIEGGAKSLYDVERGDTVVLNGKVKTKGYGHRERKGVKQTALNYVKITDRTPAGQ
jgi:hypothetical protein